MIFITLTTVLSIPQMFCQYTKGSGTGREPLENESKSEYDFLAGARELITGGPLNILLVTTPLAFLSQAAGWYDSVTFIFALLSIAPFAERLGYVTEQIALHTSDTIGGLLNATFGNATELIISIAALYKGYYRVVQLSLLGSVMSNMLLVLGSSFLIGGLRHKYQTFDKVSVLVNSTLLVFGSIIVLFPTVMVNANQVDKDGGLSLSRCCALVALIIYCAFLYFQLITHSDLESVEDDHNKEKPIRNTRSSSATADELLANGDEDGDVDIIFQIINEDEDGDDDNDDDEEEDVLGVSYALFWLTIITLFISFLSDIVVDTIQEAAVDLKVPKLFIAAIVVPIIGNAAEHASAIVFAVKNKLNITLGVAVGSSNQIALMVLPLLVVIGWFADRPMDLNLGAVESLSMLMTALIAVVALKDGQSNWLLGFVLVMTYIVIGACFWVHSDDTVGNTSYN